MIKMSKEDNSSRGLFSGKLLDEKLFSEKLYSDKGSGNKRESGIEAYGFKEGQFLQQQDNDLVLPLATEDLDAADPGDKIFKMESPIY